MATAKISVSVDEKTSAKSPNATTIAAMDEFEEMKKNPSAYKTYSSFKEVENEILEDTKNTNRLSDVSEGA